MRTRGGNPAYGPEHRAIMRDLWVDQYGEPWWTRERIVAAMRRFARENGRAPTANEWARGRPGVVRGEFGDRRSRPSMSTVVRVFGSWSAAIDAAGLASISAWTRRRRATHCRRGHRLTPANTWTTPQGWQGCRACNARRQRELRRRRAAARATS